ncbi:CLIP domain-containing serine protease B15-like isoform X2 [Ochlerotatus camptorhynchus]
MSPCVTVDGLDGNCVPLDSCNWILAKTTLMKDVISQSECGMLPDFSPLVCCAKWRNAENCGRLEHTSEIERFPWVVDVIYHRKRSFTQGCAGSLINSRFALTAAHCISDLSFILTPYSIRVKKDYRTYQDYKILRSIIHPNYNKYSINKEHDVALLKLTGKVTFDEYVQPICLPRKEDHDERSLSEGQLLTIFSKGPPVIGIVNRQKHAIAMKLRNSSVCDKIYKDVRIELKTSQICVGGEPGKDSCPGDSGSPLMQQIIDLVPLRWSQVGLVSLGPQKCGGKIPGIYVRLVDYIDWIEATVDHVD